MSTSYAEVQPAPQEWETEIGLLGRLWRGRRWYGAEWYITVTGALILLAVILGTVFAGQLAPFDPTKQVGERLIPPGGGAQAIIVPTGNDISSKADLVGQVVGVRIASTASEMVREIERGPGLTREKYRADDLGQAFEDLAAGRLDAIVVAPSEVEPFLEKYGGQLRQAGHLGQAFLLGTDHLGRDIWSRILYGARGVLGVAIVAALFSSVAGIPLGLLSGFVGGKLDRALSLVMDSIYSFPGLILAIAMAAMLGPGIINIALAIAVIYTPTYFRIVRGQTLSVKEELYVEAARSLGARAATILQQYIFPNVLPSIAVVFSLNVADAILTEAGLAYLGLGLPPPTPDWGYDLSRGQDFLLSGSWWPITFPGLMITLVALAFSMIGEGLSEILNPRLAE